MIAPASSDSPSASEHQWTRVLAVFGVMLVITIAHYATPQPNYLWHEVLERLYYLPIVFGGLAFGWKGGIVSAACAAVCYSPFVMAAWHDSAETLASKYAEMFVFVAVGVVTGILSDNRRKRAAELQKTSDELRDAHTQLQKSSDYLRRADRLSAIGQLAASLAHEIRNPLGSIEGAVDICERTTSDEKRREFLAIIKKETGRLTGLLTNLLDFARPRSLQMRQVQIDSVVGSVVKLVSHNAQQRGVLLTSEIPAGFTAVECDAQQITQALLNVTLNALQATPSGGAVSLAVSQDQSTVMISVRDTGKGIGEADLDKVFDPFFTTKEDGTGLGLAVSHQILVQHGGRVVAERNQGPGMTFTLAWPLRQPEGDSK